MLMPMNRDHALGSHAVGRVEEANGVGYRRIFPVDSKDLEQEEPRLEAQRAERDADTGDNAQQLPTTHHNADGLVEGRPEQRPEAGIDKCGIEHH
jgi:hypothetical protein